MNERSGPDGAQARAYLEGIQTDALELARKEHRRSSAFQIDETVVPFLGGAAVIVQFRRPNDNLGRDLFYFPDGSTRSGGSPPVAIPNLAELAKFVEDWSRKAARSELAALRQQVQYSEEPNSAAAVEALEAAEQALEREDQEGYLRHLERFVSLAKDMAQLAEKIPAAAAVLGPPAASVLASVLPTLQRMLGS